MIAFLCGDSHGQVRDLCRRLEAKADQIGRQPDWVFHVGSFGCWPDPKHTDYATRRRGEPTDFHDLYLRGDGMPFPTLFAPGKHEDHRWLRSMHTKGYLELLPNLHRMPNGFAWSIEQGTDRLSVLTFGGVFSPIAYNGGRAGGYFTKREVEIACSRGPVDLLLCTEAGYGARVGRFASESAGINNVCFATQPHLMAHGHYNVSRFYTHPITETPTQSLAFREVRAYHWNNEEFQFIG